LDISMTTQKMGPSPFSADASNPFLHAFEARNPFAPRAAGEVPADAPEGSYTYALVQSGPAVSSEECEVQAAAAEIMIRWGETVLHVAHLTPPRSFFVGEDQGKGMKSDFFLPAEQLGASRVPVLLVGADGVVRMVIPASATGSVTVAGEAPMSVRDLLASGKCAPCAELAGAHQIAMPSGSKASIELNGISFEIGMVNAGRSAGRVRLNGESLPYQGLSLLLHAGLLAATALFMPATAMANEDGMTEQQSYDFKVAMKGLAEKELEQKAEQQKENPTPDDRAGERGGEPGQGPKGARGAMGASGAPERDARGGVEGNRPRTIPSRAEALQEAANIGMSPILRGMHAPTVTWGDDVASGHDEKSALGHLWGATIDDAGGANGISLSGVGEFADGTGQYVGVGRVGTVGHDLLDGGGHSSFRPRGGHRTSAPSMVRVGVLTHEGHLPAEVIQRIVRQNFGRFKACYEGGLRGNPSLAGRVAVRFVIGREGEVSSAANGGSDLPDAGVVSCVTRAFYGLSFPHPASGIVTVTYPIVFSPAS
jgi:hypothetical protein